jgi:hypothetical protein
LHRIGPSPCLQYQPTWLKRPEPIGRTAAPRSRRPRVACRNRGTTGAIDSPPPFLRPRIRRRAASVHRLYRQPPVNNLSSSRTSPPLCHLVPPLLSCRVAPPSVPSELPVAAMSTAPLCTTFPHREPLTITPGCHPAAVPLRPTAHHSRALLSGEDSHPLSTPSQVCRVAKLP